MGVQVGGSGPSEALTWSGGVVGGLRRHLFTCMCTNLATGEQEAEPTEAIRTAQVKVLAA